MLQEAHPLLQLGQLLLPLLLPLLQLRELQLLALFLVAEELGGGGEDAEDVAGAVGGGGREAAHLLPARQLPPLPPPPLWAHLVLEDLALVLQEVQALLLCRAILALPPAASTPLAAGLPRLLPGGLARSPWAGALLLWGLFQEGRLGPALQAAQQGGREVSAAQKAAPPTGTLPPLPGSKPPPPP